MSFSVEQALAVCTANLAKRVQSRTNSYVLYFGNEKNRYDGKIEGVTIKELINEFRTSKATYRLAFIVKKGEDNKVLRFYNRDISKKFFSMTRIGVKRNRK